MTLLDEIGAWARTDRQPPSADLRPALFLDRDGVIVEEMGFLRRVRDVKLLPGAAPLIASYNAAKLPVVVVTNQSGIARGLFGWPEFEAVQDELRAQLAHSGAQLDAEYACGYHAAGSGAYAVANHPWRKPQPGMLLAAAETLGIDLRRSWMVGDRSSDIAAAKAAGLAGAVHVMTGHATAEHRTAALALADGNFRVESASDIADAGRILIPRARNERC